jgi:hypothetical protein
MSAWTGWDWIAYFSLGAAAIAVALPQTLKDMGVVSERVTNFLSTRTWKYTPLALFLLATLILGLRACGIPGGNSNATPTEVPAPSIARQPIAPIYAPSASVKAAPDEPIAEVPPPPKRSVHLKKNVSSELVAGIAAKTAPALSTAPAPQVTPPNGDCNQTALGHDIKQQLDCSKHYEGNHQRHLTKEQTAGLVGAARGTCGKTLINVVAANSNYEAQVYAADFVSAFKSAGCNADSPNTIPGLRPTIMGVSVAIRPWVATYQEMKVNNPDAFSLTTDLSAAGIKFIVGKSEPEFYPEASFVLVIGGDDSVSAPP